MQAKDLRTIKNILLVFLGIVLAYLLSVLSNMLVPLALALFIALLLQPALAWFEKKKIPFGVSLSLISISSLGVIALFGLMVYSTAKNLMGEKAKLLSQVRGKLDGILEWVNTIPNVHLQPTDIVDQLSQLMSADWIIKSSGTFAGFLGDFTGMFFMTSLYLIAFLGGILKYEQYIGYLEEGMGDDGKVLRAFEEVKNSIVTYIKIKFFMSFCTGLCYGLVCWFFGLDFALFWGFLAFVLNFIPTVGSIVATVPPLLMGMIQVDSFGLIITLVLILVIVQLFFGNIIEPKLTGSSLSLNTVTVILGLVFWGYLWGVPGMLLSVPLLVLTKVILSQIPDAKILVRLMGGGGTPLDKG